MSRLEEIQLRFINGEKVTMEDMMYVFQQAERVRNLEDDVDTLTLELDTFDVRMLRGSQNRVVELEEELNRERKRNTKVAFKNLKYKQALEEIAHETGTPYADIAIKALAGDNS